MGTHVVGELCNHFELAGCRQNHGVVRASARAGYSGYFALEYVVKEHESVADVDNISETIRLRDLLRNCEEYVDG